MCQDLQYVFTLHIIMALLGRQANLTLFVKSGMVQTDCPLVFASHQSMSAASTELVTPKKYSPTGDALKTGSLLGPKKVPV